MTEGLALWIAAAIGVAATLGVIAGTIGRARGLGADREFAALLRPANLADLPFVTIVVPARNEERNIALCLESLLALDYPRFEILVVDDHSTDRTAGIVREVSGRSASPPDMRLLSLADEPAGEGTVWANGKSRALWHGAGLARGQWILFVDADTRLKPDALWRAASLCRRHSLQALSLSGTIVNSGFWGGVLEAVILPAVFLSVSWRRINDPEDPAAWMNGNFILYERAAYLAVDGHRAIAGLAQDDLALALHSKAKGVRSLFLPVSEAYECRDFAGFAEAYRGWARRVAAAGEQLRLPRRAYALQVFGLFVVALWPVLAAAAGLSGALTASGILGPSFGTWALAQLGSVILFQGALRAAMKMPVWPAVFVPLGAALAITVVIGGYRARFVKRAVEFRGRAIAVHDAAAEVPRDPS
jgi:chlorobactene glucosyltransferase